MGGKHRYEPEAHRATWVPADEDADPQRVEHLNTGLIATTPAAPRPWWSRLRGKS
jgi:hypothetical protein